VTESLLLPPIAAVILMCKKSDQIEIRIQPLRRLTTPGLDRFSLAMMRAAIESPEADKAALKCETK